MTNEHENHTMNMSDVGTSIGPRIRTLGLPLDRKVLYPLNHAIPHPSNEFVQDDIIPPMDLTRVT